MDHLSGADEPGKGASWLEGAALPLPLGERRGRADLCHVPKAIIVVSKYNPNFGLTDADRILPHRLKDRF